jgi:hypothetical protein
VDTPLLQDADGGDARLGAKSVGVVRRTSSNKPFSGWGEFLDGDDVVAAAMIDRWFTTPRSSPSRATVTASKTATWPDPPAD